MNAIGGIFDIAHRINAIRDLTGDKAHGSAVRKGSFQHQYITFDGDGRSTVEPLSKWMPLPEFLAYLDGEIDDLHDLHGEG